MTPASIAKVLILLPLLSQPLIAVADSSQSTPEEDLPLVTYISGSSIYVGAGRDQGLQPGQELQVLRKGQLVSVLRVRDTSSNRAACTVVEGYDPPEVGDAVRYPRPDPTTSPEPSAQAAGSDASFIAFARISHIDQETVFIDEGQDAGLRGGDRLAVMREGTTVTVLEVTDLSADRASCTIVDGLTDLETGDTVRLPIRNAGDAEHQDDAKLDTLTAQTALETARTRQRRQRSPIHGRIGIRYLAVRDQTGAGGDLSQPAFDLRLDGNDIASHLDIAVDVRSRRTYRTVVNSKLDVTDQTRVYRLATTIHDPRSRFRMTIGRQYSPSLASVSTFDGVLLDFVGNHWSTGMFGGTQPGLIDYRYSDEIKEYGAFVQAHSRTGSARSWSVTFGTIGSYHLGEINREFAYLQTLYTSPRLTLYAAGEVDYNRDWKIEVGENQLSLTNSYFHLSQRVGGGFTLRAGYDNRRNIRLYRDFITPEVEFDDSFRRGAWVGFTQRIKRHFRFGMDAKRSQNEVSGDADNYTFVLGVSGLTRASVSGYYRGSYYTNDTVEGLFHSLITSVSMTRFARITLRGGLRDDANRLDPALDSQAVWYGLDLDFNLGRHWYLQVSAERTEAPIETSEQTYLGVTYRF